MPSPVFPIRPTWTACYFCYISSFVYSSISWRPKLCSAISASPAAWIWHGFLSPSESLAIFSGLIFVSPSIVSYKETHDFWARRDETDSPSLPSVLNFWPCSCLSLLKACPREDTVDAMHGYDLKNNSSIVMTLNVLISSLASCRSVGLLRAATLRRCFTNSLLIVS